MKKVKWGILGVAAIAVNKVIPAMKAGELTDIVAIASRDPERAQKAAQDLDIPQCFGSYDQLLQDPKIEAVYNPLPNHLHVPWTIKAAQCGKHVLCEKPLGLSANEAVRLLAARNQYGVKIEEAFMIRTHPQWLKTKRLIETGRIGELRAIQGAFSYFNRDPTNVRNVPEWGGGGLMDIGCYPITASRFILEREPERVIGLLEEDADFGVDRLTSAILDFHSVHSSFVCGTQQVPYQRMHFFGTEGRIEIEIPFNAPADLPCRIFVDNGDLLGRTTEIIHFPIVDQYTIQGDLFSRSIREDQEVPIPLEDSVANMSVIDALFRSARSGQWEKLEIPSVD